MIRLLLLGCLFFLAKEGFAQSWKTEQGKVTFLSESKFNTFSGTSEQLQGIIDLDKNLVDFYVDLNTLKTGIGLRDRHMRDNYLETKKFPYAEFTGSLAEIPALAPDKTVTVQVNGTFKIHGVAQPRTFTGTLLQNRAGDLLLEANFEVKLVDFKISVPNVLTYELANNLSVTVTTTLKSVQP